MSKDNPSDIVAKISEWNRKELGVPSSFLKRLRTDDDWTTVIKLHAMIEAALNRLITKKLGHENLAGFVARLDTGDKQKGKLAFAKTFALLSDDARNFVRVLSNLRNDLVHDVREFEFNFLRWVEKMTPELRKNLANYSVAILSEKIEIDGQSQNTREAVFRHPKYIVSVACFGIISILYHHEHGLIAVPPAPDQSTPKR